MNGWEMLWDALVYYPNRDPSAVSQDFIAYMDCGPTVCATKKPQKDLENASFRAIATSLSDY